MALNPYTDAATQQLTKVGLQARLLRTAEQELKKFPAKPTEDQVDELQGLLAALCEALDLNVDRFFPWTPEVREEWERLTEGKTEEEQEELDTWHHGKRAADALRFILGITTKA